MVDSMYFQTKKMNNNREVPFEFIRQRHSLTWREVELGIREQWLRGADAVALAMEQVVQGDEGPGMLALAAVLKEDEGDVAELVSDLVASFPGNSEQDARLTWMRILLAWVYEMRASFSDPLGIVEQIYADFGYQDEIRHLVRYNPSEDSNSELGEDFLLRRWGDYLNGLSEGREGLDLAIQMVP
ncbi:MAG: DUF2247 family protein [Kofleriaceae bacterium]